ncbi:AlpA family phage regulatory protein [Paraburkholderia hospita]|jgi:prophage regulatory protein|uniref:AlpA family phage regulatory protein n=1 Tax=Paraburkholderia hospita TaxID=169430 RepID=UPI001F3136B8|nr:AlpA family phage regulatory protein [Paraburkholderia hospita]
MKARVIAFTGQSHDLYFSRLQREKCEWHCLTEKTASKCYAGKAIASVVGGSASAKAPATARRPNSNAAAAVTASGDDGGDSDPERPPAALFNVPQATPTAPARNTAASTHGKSRILRMSEVTVRSGYSRASIYGLMRAGHFPASFKLGARAIGFLESEIDEWIESRISARAEFK